MNKMYKSFLKLKSYCEQEEFKGYDPYDGLTSKFFRSIPIVRDIRFCRLAWLQLFKRLPINFRPLVGIAKQHNAKGLGLFLSGYCNLYRIDGNRDHLNQAILLAEKLVSLQSVGYSGACWGYYFDWQARAFFQPENTPTVVASTYVSSAFLDLYDLTKNEKYLNIARSTCDFVLNDLNRTFDEDGCFAFSYSPLDKSVVFNASLLGSRILSRVYSYTNESHLKEEAEKSVAFCCKHQKNDGSWAYGTYEFHQWLDNFHTGFNLECISDYIKFTGDMRYQSNFELGLKYYLETFFTEGGIAKYYHNQMYPVDIHSPSQLIVTLYKTGQFKQKRELAGRVLNWTIDNMQSNKGYFYYQIKKRLSSRIPYMRWAQSWMFYAFSIYFLATNDEKN